MEDRTFRFPRTGYHFRGARVDSAVHFRSGWPCMEQMRYDLDPTDRIMWVGGDWGSFATENDGQDVAEPNVVGRSIWEFISGREMKMVLGEVFSRVRRSGRPLSLPFRCDAPKFRRSMLMEIVPDPDGSLHVTTRLASEEERPVPMPIMDRRTPRERKPLRMCSWCNRFGVPPWVFAEEAVARLDLFGEGTMPAITHGICPTCEHRLLASVESGTEASEFEQWIERV